jgi:hypothetical protein
MSAADVQSALVRIVRLPDAHRGAAIEELLADLDLNEREKWRLRALATSPYVAKFGREQRAARFQNSVRQVIPLTVRVLGEERLESVFGAAFEPAHAALGVADIARAFVEFLVEGWDAWAGPLVAPAFARDLARFELAEFSALGFALAGRWRVPAASLLRPDVPLLVLDLDYDLARWVEDARAVKGDEAFPYETPPMRPNTVLFARVRRKDPREDDDDAYVLHQFEIDASVKAFLAAEGSPIASRPACFAELVALGVCRAPPKAEP